MENRKRPRLDLQAAQSLSGLECLQGETSPNSLGSATLATIGGQSYILSNSSSPLPANILLTICDDDDSDDDSQEYIIDSSLLTQIKQEHTQSTTPALPALQASAVQSSNSNTLLQHHHQHHQQQHHHQTVPQFHIVNQSGKALTNATSLQLNSLSSTTTTNNGLANNLIPSSVQLPSGCEIYLVKEFLETNNTTPQIQQQQQHQQQHDAMTKATTPTTTTSIKIEPGTTHMPVTAAGSIHQIQIKTPVVAISQQQQQIISSNSTSSSSSSSSSASSSSTSSCTTLGTPPDPYSCSTSASTLSLTANVINTISNCNNNNNNNNNNNSSTIPATTTIALTTPPAIASEQDPLKRSLILEAYKKRDDKRRATHNEVERRRRDKINNWIFKLKEMLPTDKNMQMIKEAASSAINTTSNNITSSILNTTNGGRSLGVTAGTQTIAMPASPPPTTTSRTPPSDSKSQILIKACEYIKSMQDEIKSLRECLTENENLRLSNQRLQDELNYLRNKHIALQNNNNHESVLLNPRAIHNCELTLNSLNSTYANVHLFSNNNLTNDILGGVGLGSGGGGSSMRTTSTSSSAGGSPTATLSGVSFTKRELIITDYVD